MNEPSKRPTVSVCIITYNHEKFIAQALQSAIEQKTNFRFEIVIGEDASTDRTLEICSAFQKNHPEIIRLQARPENLGMMGNFVQTINECTGQYVALLEGDDYWTRLDKLQTQVDFLDNNPDFSICGHAVQVLDMITGASSILPARGHAREVLTLKDLLGAGSAGSTCSLVYRNKIFGEYPQEFKAIRGADFPLQVLCATHGKMRMLPDVMGVYRIHDRGAYYYLDLDAERQARSTPELLVENMLFGNSVINRYFQGRFWFLILRLNAYPHWVASRYYYSQKDFLRSAWSLLSATPGLLPPPAWLPAKDFIGFLGRLLVRPLYELLLKIWRLLLRFKG